MTVRYLVTGNRNRTGCTSILFTVVHLVRVENSLQVGIRAGTPASGYAADFSAGSARLPKARARSRLAATGAQGAQVETGKELAGGGGGVAGAWKCENCTFVNQVGLLRRSAGDMLVLFW